MSLPRRYRLQRRRAAGEQRAALTVRITVIVCTPASLAALACLCVDEVEGAGSVAAAALEAAHFPTA